MEILYIGEKQTHDLYLQGIVPSHWLYGAIQMEKAGHKVIWESEKSGFFHDWNLISRHHHDIIFIPNLNLHNHMLLLLLAALGIYRKTIIAFLHHTPSEKTGFRAKFSKFLMKGCGHVFFLSEKTRTDLISCGFIPEEKCSVPGWGADLDFYQNYQKNRTPKASDGTYYVSTGKENRDFEILIEAFKRTGAPLKILTSKTHAGANYENLPELCKDIPNIEVVLTENSGTVFPQMLEMMAGAKALVCPLKKDKLNYCVGLSTITDAEGLEKPLIITANTYHSQNRLENFNVVSTSEDWVSAIENLKESIPSNYSIQKCWENMRVYFEW